MPLVSILYLKEQIIFDFMADLMLRCGCMVTEEGEFIVGQGCSHCKECNAVSKLHPFGNDRITELKIH